MPGMTERGEQLKWKIHDEMKAILDNAESEKRGLTAAERYRYDELDDELNRLSQSRGRKTDHTAAAHPNDWHLHGGSTGTVEFADANGNPIRAVSHSESMRDVVREQGWREQGPEPLSIGRAIRGVVTGKWDGAEREMAAVQTGSGSAGGFLISPHMAADVLDLARAQSVVSQAGARFIDMPASEFLIGRVVGDPTPHWRPELGRIPVSRPSFGLYRMSAKSCGVLIPLSLEFLEDARNAVTLMERTIATVMGLEIDRVALRGGGTGDAREPTGIRYSTELGVKVTDNFGAITHDGLLDAMTPIENSNGAANAWAMSPAVNGEYRKLKDGEGLYLQPPADLSALRKIVSTQVPDDEIYFGDFTTLLIGVRSPIRIEILREGTADQVPELPGGRTDLSAVQDAAMFIRLLWRGDVLPSRPDWFHVLAGVTTPE